ncbi:MAG: protein jag [Clostridia bacterium]|nr:protein jag [Clostridia bacterium]
MRKECVKEAATIEEAKALIAAELGAEISAITFEVIREPKKKAFGLFGGNDASVKGVLETNGEPAEEAADYVRRVLAAMNAQAEVTVQEDDDDGCTVDIRGEHLGFIIGRRGDTLDALQYLAGLVANRARSKYYRVTVDVGDYREKREKTLVSLARKMAGQSARTGRKNSLEPMNPYERRIIHTAVQGIEGATSWSVGSEPNRHVVIGPSDDNPVKSRGKRGGRGGKGKREKKAADQTTEQPTESKKPRRKLRDSEYVITPPERKVRAFVPRSNPLPTAEDAAPKDKTASETEATATLYGRIEL